MIEAVAIISGRCVARNIWIRRSWGERIEARSLAAAAGNSVVGLATRPTKSA